MKHFKTPLLKVLIVTITVGAIIACSDDFDLNNLDETIFVRHKNADMPAYIKGKSIEKVFLITLHGGPGGTGLGLRSKAFTKIEEQYAVVYFDQRGSGNSQGHYSEGDVTIDLMAEDVLALVKVMKYKFGNDSRFFLLGGSWGGTLGTTTLLKDQSNFKGWIGVDGAYSPALLYDQTKETLTATANVQIALGNNLGFWSSILDFVSQVSPENNLDDYLELNEKAFEAEKKLVDDAFIKDPENGKINNTNFFVYNYLTQVWNSNQIASIIENQGLFQTLDYTNQLQEITIPSLFISGQYDMVVPLTAAQEAFDNIDSSSKYLSVFEKSGHAPHFSEPALFADEVLQFIEEHK